MDAHVLRPSAEDLRQIREFVRLVEARRGRDLLSRELAALAGKIDPRFGVTIDLSAAAELGHPLVVLRAAGARAAASGLLANLSRRERDVAGLLAQGLRNRDIAGELGITLATVKDHVHHILHKSGVRSRAVLIAISVRSRQSPSEDGLTRPRGRH